MRRKTEPADEEFNNISCNRKIFEMLNRPERTIAFWGGSASGKTYSACEWAISQMMVPHPEYGEEGWKCYLCRRFRTNAVKDIWEDPLRPLLIKFGILDKCDINRTTLTIQYTPDGTQIPNVINVRGLDSPDKVKGSPGVWIIDEADQISEEVYLQLLNRSGRAYGTHGKVVLMWNPVSKSSWLYNRFFADSTPQPNFVDLHLTYRDNIWNLDPTYVEQLLDYKGKMWDVYTLGKWGTAEGLIYAENQWRIEEAPEGILKYHQYDCIGIDWGTNNPTAVVGICIFDPSPATDMRMVVAVDELYYRAGNQAIANVKDFLCTLDLPSIPIYCDSARPDSIDDLRRAGFDARKASKHVFDGLTYMQGCNFIITSRSTNVIREIENYQWDKNPDGVWLDEPLKEWDHAMDAMRYAVYTYHQETTSITAIPKIYLNSTRSWA